jgi:hypothetical protein
MENKLFVKKNIKDFSKTPIVINVKEDTVRNGNYYYIDFTGTAIPEAFKEHYPEQENERLHYLMFTIELRDNRGYVKLPFKAVLNSDLIKQQMITPIKNKDGYIFDKVLIHFPEDLPQLVTEAVISVYIMKELKPISE